MTLEITEAFGHCDVMRTLHRRTHLRLADHEHHAHALRRRERHIEPRHPPTPAQQLAGGRVLAREDGVQLIAVDLAAQTQPRGRASAPVARRLRPADVVASAPLDTAEALDIGNSA